MDGTRANRCTVFGAKPSLLEATRTIRLEEYVGVADEHSQGVCVCGGGEVELGRALSVRGLDVEDGEGRQVRRRHEEDVRPMHWGPSAVQCSARLPCEAEARVHGSVFQ